MKLQQLPEFLNLFAQEGFHGIWIAPFGRAGADGVTLRMVAEALSTNGVLDMVLSIPRHDDVGGSMFITLRWSGGGADNVFCEVAELSVMESPQGSQQLVKKVVAGARYERKMRYAGTPETLVMESIESHMTPAFLPKETWSQLHDRAKWVPAGLNNYVDLELKPDRVTREILLAIGDWAVKAHALHYMKES